MARASEENLEQINVRVTETFLEAIDETWQGRGYNTRSEFVRHVLHDAVENPTFDRDELIALLEAEEDIRDGRTMSADDARERYGTDADE